MSVQKTFAIILNALLVASGAALATVTLAINEISLKFLSTQQVDLTWIVAVLTVAGAMAKAAGISGIVWACCCEIMYILYTSFGLILAVFIMEAVFVITSSVDTVDKFYNYVDNDAMKQMAQYNNQSSSVKEEWDNFQTYGECCGLNGYDDWRIMGITAIPTTCCKNKENNCDTSDFDNIYTQGCKDILKDKFLENTNILRWASYAMMFVDFAVAVFDTVILVRSYYTEKSSYWCWLWHW